ncbi:Hypothetical_protein [Hexamita inflata]|uniref:Hypothetical_protein n=1 Tax=Hexamita inflata TaxID=28002 RepID=A0AA86NWT9_9EUKA|nr:Hypothetical protein HINF_LOCUS15280 [Hexamita inflata]
MFQVFNYRSVTPSPSDPALHQAPSNMPFLTLLYRGAFMPSSDQVGVMQLLRQRARQQCLLKKETVIYGRNVVSQILRFLLDSVVERVTNTLYVQCMLGCTQLASNQQKSQHTRLFRVL